MHTIRAAEMASRYPVTRFKAANKKRRISVYIDPEHSRTLEDRASVKEFDTVGNVAERILIWCLKNGGGDTFQRVSQYPK